MKSQIFKFIGPVLIALVLTMNLATAQNFSAGELEQLLEDEHARSENLDGQMKQLETSLGMRFGSSEIPTALFERLRTARDHFEMKETIVDYFRHGQSSENVDLSYLYQIARNEAQTTQYPVELTQRQTQQRLLALVQANQNRQAPLEISLIKQLNQYPRYEIRIPSGPIINLIWLTPEPNPNQRYLITNADMNVGIELSRAQMLESLGRDTLFPINSAMERQNTATQTKLETLLQTLYRIYSVFRTYNELVDFHQDLSQQKRESENKVRMYESKLSELLDIPITDIGNHKSSRANEPPQITIELSSGERVQMIRVNKEMYVLIIPGIEGGFYISKKRLLKTVGLRLFHLINAAFDRTIHQLSERLEMAIRNELAPVLTQMEIDGERSAIVTTNNGDRVVLSDEHAVLATSGKWEIVKKYHQRDTEITRNSLEEEAEIRRGRDQLTALTEDRQTILQEQENFEKMMNDDEEFRSYLGTMETIDWGKLSKDHGKLGGALRGLGQIGNRNFIRPITDVNWRELQEANGRGLGRLRGIGQMAENFAAIPAKKALYLSASTAMFFSAVAMGEFYTCISKKDPTICNAFLDSLQHPTTYLGFSLFVVGNHSVAASADVMSQLLFSKRAGMKFLMGTGGAILGMAAGMALSDLFHEVTQHPLFTELIQSGRIKDEQQRWRTRRIILARFRNIIIQEEFWMAKWPGFASFLAGAGLMKLANMAIQKGLDAGAYLTKGKRFGSALASGARRFSNFSRAMPFGFRLFTEGKKLFRINPLWLIGGEILQTYLFLKVADWWELSYFPHQQLSAHNKKLSLTKQRYQQMFDHQIRIFRQSADIEGTTQYVRTALRSNDDEAIHNLLVRTQREYVLTRDYLETLKESGTPLDSDLKEHFSHLEGKKLFGLNELIELTQENPEEFSRIETWLQNYALRYSRLLGLVRKLNHIRACLRVINRRRESDHILPLFDVPPVISRPELKFNPLEEQIKYVQNLWDIQRRIIMMNPHTLQGRYAKLKDQLERQFYRIEKYNEWIISGMDRDSEMWKENEGSWHIPEVNEDADLLETVWHYGELVFDDGNDDRNGSRIDVEREIRWMTYAFFCGPRPWFSVSEGITIKEFYELSTPKVFPYQIDTTHPELCYADHDSLIGSVRAGYDPSTRDAIDKEVIQVGHPIQNLRFEHPELFNRLRDWVFSIFTSEQTNYVDAPGHSNNQVRGSSLDQFLDGMVNDLINSDFERKPVNKNTLWQYVSLFNSRNSFYEPVLKKLEEDVAQNDLHPIKYRIHQLEDEFKRKEINERIQQLQSTNNHFDQTGLENIQNELNQLERQHQEMEQEHAQYLETASATQELLEEKEQEYKAFFIDYQSMVKEVLGMPDNEDPQVVSLVTGILATTGLVDNLFNKLADYFKPYGPIDEHLTTTYMVFGHEALWGNDDPSENYFLALHNRRVQFIKDEVEKSKHLPEGQISVYLDDMLINNKVANQYAKRLGLGIEHDLIRRFETLVQKSMLEFLTGSYWDVTKESVKSTVNKDRFHIRWNEQAQAEAGVSNLADESFSQGVIGSLDDEKTYWRNLHDSYQNFVNDFGVAIEQTLEKSLAVEELLHYYLQPVSASRDFIPFPIQDRMALEMTQEDYNRVIVGYMNYVIRPSDNLTGN